MKNYRTYGQHRRFLYRSYTENNDTASHITDFCEIVIGGRKIVNSDKFFGVTNIRTNVQHDSSYFERLLHKMVSKKLFMRQDICYINVNGERKLCTVSAYIK